MSRAFRNTVIPFVVAGTALLFIGTWAHDRCPAATRIGEVWSCLR